MRVPEPFDLDLVVRSHGWYDLPPWTYDPERRLLARPLRLASGRTVVAEVAPGERAGWLAVRLVAAGRLRAADAADARAQLATCLALDQDLAPFHARAAELAAGGDAPARRARDRLPDLRWAVTRGAGRLLRSPTVFEDAVKTLCTTNCTWALTRVMVGNLVAKLGEPAPLDPAAPRGEARARPPDPAVARCFPSPAAMATAPEGFYRDEIRAGYRARALRALAVQVASGALDLEAWRTSPLSADELAREIRTLDGFGPYAAEHLLKLLGRFEHLAIDSWIRQKLGKLRGMRRLPSDRTIARWYAPFGAWAGLALWLEATADWHGPEPSWPSRSTMAP
jgi:3-methyladenine DNA glycosylase/8-oxoguanine DNA glycosylase